MFFCFFLSFSISEIQTFCYGENNSLCPQNSVLFHSEQIDSFTNLINQNTTEITVFFTESMKDNSTFLSINKENMKINLQKHVSEDNQKLNPTIFFSLTSFSASSSFTFSGLDVIFSVSEENLKFLQTSTLKFIETKASLSPGSKSVVFSCQTIFDATSYISFFNTSLLQNIILTTDSDSFEINNDVIILSNTTTIAMNPNIIYRTSSNSVKMTKNPSVNQMLTFKIDFDCGTNVDLIFDDSFQTNSLPLNLQIYSTNAKTINIIAPIDPSSIIPHIMEKASISFNTENEVVYNYLYFYDETEVILIGAKSLSSYSIILQNKAKVNVFQTLNASSNMRAPSFIDCYAVMCNGPSISLNSFLIIQSISILPGTTVNVDSGIIYFTATCTISYNLQQLSRINAGKDEPNTIIFNYSPPNPEDSLANHINETIDLYCGATFICDLYMDVNHILLQSQYTPFDGSSDSVSLHCRETSSNNSDSKSICASLSILKDDEIEKKEDPTPSGGDMDPGKFTIYKTSTGDIAVIVVFSLLIAIAVPVGFFIYYKKMNQNIDGAAAPPP